jgi:hypothetical protein
MFLSRQLDLYNINHMKNEMVSLVYVLPRSIYNIDKSIIPFYNIWYTSLVNIRYQKVSFMKNFIWLNIPYSICIYTAFLYVLVLRMITRCKSSYMRYIKHGSTYTQEYVRGVLKIIPLENITFEVLIIFFW